MEYTRDYCLEGIIRDWFSQENNRQRYNLDYLMHGSDHAYSMLYSDMCEEGVIGPEDFDQLMLSYAEYSKTL